MCYYFGMVFRVLLCFAVPIVWGLYAVLARRELAPYLFLFLCLSLLSAVAASGVQALTQPFLSEQIIFSGGVEGLALHSFVQAGLIEETFKAIFFFVALRRVFASSRDLSRIDRSVAFYFAVLFGSIFASFETLAGFFYFPGSAAIRIGTAHVMHPVAMLITASGAFLAKKPAAGCILSWIAAAAVHGLYNFTAGMRGVLGALAYTAAALILTAWLWAMIFSGARPSSQKKARQKSKKKRKKQRSVGNRV